MLSRKTFVSFASRKSIIAIPHLAFLILPLVLLAGCTNDGAGGPIVSSLSTPTDEPARLDSDQGFSSQATDSGHEEDPKITMTLTSTGVTAHVTWDRPSDFNVDGYSIHYGKRSSAESASQESNSEEVDSEEPGQQESNPEEPNSCSQGESLAVEDSSATITGLEPNTQYFFAIRAFNKTDSVCSTEITAVTPSAQS